MAAATQTSSKRVEANRRNAKKSTGPRTPVGKRRSRLNAIKHGLCARIPVLPGEDPDAFRRHVDGFSEALQPRDAVEIFLAEQAAFAAWRAQRADRAEAAHLAAILRAARIGTESGRREEVAALGRWLLATQSRQKQDAAKSLLPFLDGDRQLAFRKRQRRADARRRAPRGERRRLPMAAGALGRAPRGAGAGSGMGPR
jgi:hypothetical protein